MDLTTVSWTRLGTGFNEDHLSQGSCLYLGCEAHSGELRRVARLSVYLGNLKEHVLFIVTRTVASAVVRGLAMAT